MGIALNPNKLQLKYELKIHRKTKEWPTAEDVLYEISRYLEYSDDNTITKKKLSEIVSDNEKLENIITTLCKKNFFKEVDENTFQLLKHGWE